MDYDKRSTSTCANDKTGECEFNNGRSPKEEYGNHLSNNSNGSHGNVFPEEMLEHILSFLQNKQLKSVSLASRNLSIIAGKLLWNSPSFKNPVTPDELEQMVHLPIKTFNAAELDYQPDGNAQKFVEIFQKMPQFKGIVVGNSHQQQILNIDTSLSSNAPISIEAFQLFAPFITAVHTAGLAREWKTPQVVDKLSHVDLPSIKSVVIDGLFVFTLENLKAINKLPVTRVYLSNLCKDTSAWPQYPQLPHLCGLGSLRSIILDVHMNAREIKQLQGLPVTDIYLPALNLPQLSGNKQREIIDALLGLGTVRDVYIFKNVQLHGYDNGYESHQFKAEDLLRVSRLPINEVSSAFLRLQTDTDVDETFAALSTVNSLKVLHLSRQHSTAYAMEAIQRNLPLVSIVYYEGKH